MPRLFALVVLCAAIPSFALAAAPGRAAGARNDYADAAFTRPLTSGLRAFYRRDFVAAGDAFHAALAVIPDNTLALSMLNAAAAQNPAGLDALIDTEEDALTSAPRSALAHTRLAYSYMFASIVGRDRLQDAREELNLALTLDPSLAAAHTALGIMREGERSTNRAKTEFLAALRVDPHDVLAREYLALIYQTDLRDPHRALSTLIDVPNLVPDYADVYFHLASVLDDLGQYDAAITYATRGVEADVGHVGESGQHGYTLLARIYLDDKRPSDARRVLRASISAGADVGYATTLLAKIDALPSPTPAPSR